MYIGETIRRYESAAFEKKYSPDKCFENLSVEFSNSF